MMADRLDLLIKAQGNRCYLCGQSMLDRSRKLDGACLQDWRRLRSTLDHIQPKSKYFYGEQLFAAAHNKCNSYKGDRNPYPCEVIFGNAMMQFAGIKHIKDKPFNKTEEQKMIEYHMEKMAERSK